MRETDKGKPSYDLGEVKRFVAQDSFGLAGRAARFMLNHYGEESTEAVKGVFAHMEKAGFRKTVELDKRPGTMADVYNVEFDDVTWYVKFFIDSGSSLRVEIWSCNWDGCIH